MIHDASIRPGMNSTPIATSYSADDLFLNLAKMAYEIRSH